jgi:hypothetical protein
VFQTPEVMAMALFSTLRMVALISSVAAAVARVSWPVVLLLRMVPNELVPCSVSVKSPVPVLETVPSVVAAPSIRPDQEAASERPKLRKVPVDIVMMQPSGKLPAVPEPILRVPPLKVTPFDRVSVPLPASVVVPLVWVSEAALTEPLTVTMLVPPVWKIALLPSTQRPGAAVPGVALSAQAAMEPESQRALPAVRSLADEAS